MRFLSAKKPSTLSSHGTAYKLNPVSFPHVNINDILAAEYGYIYRTVRECSDRVQEIFLDAEKLPGFPLRAQRISDIPPESSVLLMRIGGLGDMVMLFPVLRHIKKHLAKGSKTTICTFRYARELFNNSGMVNGVVDSPIRLSDLLKYDYYIEFLDEESRFDIASMNMTDYYFRSINVDHSNLTAEEKTPRLPADSASSKEIIDLFQKLRRRNWKALVLSCLFSSDPSRNFPIPHFEYLTKRFPDVLFIVPYAAKDLPRRSSIAAGMNNVVHLDTSRSLADFMTAVKCSDIVLSPDSSPYHIAAAFGKPALALFGSIEPGLRISYYPLVTPVTGLYKGEFCTSPCGLSNPKWISLKEGAGEEILRRGLYKPAEGCPEAIRRKTKYSPCLIAIPMEKLAQALDGKLKDYPNERTKRKGGKEMAKKTGPRKNKGRVKKEVLISACMIVKNEEALLPQCLESIKDVVDEIVVVDTGSTDRTVEIAESFGARIYHHPWENDFSRHRNQSISYARGKWIFIIDADEELDRRSASLMRRAVSEVNSSMIAVMVRSYTKSGGSATCGGLSVRIFQNKKGIKYKGTVHNQLSIIENPVHCPIIIWHYGYNLSDEKLAEKRKRSLRLLLEQSKKRPDDEVTHHHLAVTYFAEKDWENAIFSAQRAIDLYDIKGMKGIAWTYFIACFSLYKKDELDAALKLAREALEKFPRSIDLHHFLACVNVEKRDLEAVLRHGSEYLFLKNEYETDPSEFGIDVFEMDQKEGDVHMAMGFAFYLSGQKDRAYDCLKDAELTLRENRDVKLAQIANFYLAREEYEKALYFFRAMESISTSFDPGLLKIPRCLEKTGRANEVLSFFDTLLERYPEEYEIPLQRGLYLTTIKEFKEAAESFKKACSLDPENPDILVNMGVALSSCGRTKEAEEQYLKALEIDSSRVSARLNLGTLLYLNGRYGESLYHLEYAWKQTARPYVGLALSHSLILSGNIEGAVPLCEDLLRTLDLPTSHTLKNLQDMGRLYFLMAQRLGTLGDNNALQIAVQLGKILTERPAQASRETAGRSFK